MRRFERLLSVAVATFFVLFAQAQNGVLSPYSRYGIGVLPEQSVGINKAMGGAGIGLRQRNTLSLVNPASYSTVDTLTFLFDMGFSLTNGNFRENEVRKNVREASVDYIAMQFRLMRNLGFTASFMPFSNVGYSYSETSNIRSDRDGDLTATNTYSGEGGLRQVSLGLGWAPFKWLSVGADAGYLFGDITHLITNRYNDTSIFTLNKGYYASLNGWRFNFGLQSWFKLGEGSLTVGLVYAPAMTMKDDSFILKQIVNSSSVAEESDTVTLKKGFGIADRYGFGLSYSTEKWTACADLSYERWSNARFFGVAGLDRLKVSLGVSYQPEKNNRQLFVRSTYRAGLFYSQPYFNVGSQPGPSEYGASIGISLPIINHWNNLIEVDVSGQYVHVRPSTSGMITENYLRLSLGIAFNERWFVKWKVE